MLAYPDSATGFIQTHFYYPYQFHGCLDFSILKRSARKSRMERIENEPYKGNNGGEREAGHHREEKTTMIWSCQKDARGGKKKRTSKRNVDEKSTSSHDNKKFRTRSMEKQGGMAFCFQKVATAVIKPDR
jgi:hypothetical protein